MAILSTNDLRTRIQTLVCENTDDDTLDFLQDFDDTITDLESKGATDYQELYKAEVQKNKDLDASWRKRYRDRFFNGDDDDESNDSPKFKKPKYSTEPTLENTITIDDLFTTK